MSFCQIRRDSVWSLSRSVRTQSQSLTPSPAGGGPSRHGCSSGLGPALPFLPFTAPEPRFSKGRAGSSPLWPTCSGSAGRWGPVGSASLSPDLDSRLLWASTPDFCPERDVGKRTGGPEVGSLSPFNPLSISLPVPEFQHGEHHAPLPCGPRLLCPCSDSVCHALGSPVSQAPRTPAFLGALSVSGEAREPSAESTMTPRHPLGFSWSHCFEVSGRGQAWVTGAVLSPFPSPGRPAILRNGHLSSLENLQDIGRKELA